MNFLFNRQTSNVLNMTYEGGGQNFQQSSIRKTNNQGFEFIFNSEVVTCKDLAKKHIKSSLTKIFELHAARCLDTIS